MPSIAQCVFHRVDVGISFIDLFEMICHAFLPFSVIRNEGMTLQR